MSDLPLRAELVGEAPYGAPTDPLPVRLNVNENPYPPPAQVVHLMAGEVAAVLGDLNRYPDREALGLRTALAGYLGRGLGAERIWPANGSNEVMQQILSAFAGPGRSMLSFAPTYSMYPVYARDTMTRYRTEPRTADHRIDFAGAQRSIAADPPSVTVVASPNNPTGTPLGLDEVRRLHELVSGSGVLVVDEAYAEFSDEPSALHLLDGLDRLIVVRTLSKAFGLAGLRVGYAVTSPEIVDALRIVRLPYHLSATTQIVATTALRYAEELLAPVAEVVAERQRQAAWLREHGVEVADSQANFLLIGPLGDSHDVFTRLQQHGVLVRETGVPACLRVSIGTPEENEAFRRAFSAVTEPRRETP